LADQKRAEREQRHTQRRRGIVLRVGAAAAAVLLLVVGSCAMYRSDLLAVHRYRLVGARHLTLARVLALANVPAPDATLIRFPSAAVQLRISRDPWVASVTIHRRLPDTIEFEVRERVPVALVDAGNVRWAVDASGSVIATQAASGHVSLPVVRQVTGITPAVGSRIASPSLENALAVLAGVSDVTRAMVVAINAPSVDGTALMTKDNVEILVGRAENLAEKDAIARRILASQHGKVVFIDVRSTDRPVSRGIAK
jgi:cell division protein FtsQ